MDARGAALMALSATLAGETLEGAFAITDKAGARRLERRDRAFARLLVLTTLRRLGQIDDVIARCVEKPNRLPAREQNILRLGCAQLLFLGTPAHAAVSAGVDATRSSPLKGLVNAVLRRVGREGADIVARQDAPRLNTPDWLWQQLTEGFGVPVARAIAGAHVQEPPLDLTARWDPDGCAAQLGGELLPTGSVRLRDAGLVEDLPGFADGAWWVQDTAAALPARLLLNAIDPAGAVVADLCAAPGGKTAQLAAAGVQVFSIDRDAQRLSLVADNLRRLHLKATLIAADATVWQPPQALDAVLLDAPCTATGTIRRHPDVAWHKTAASAEALADLQARLLRAAAGMLKPGGVLVYSVCSLDAREGARRIDAFLSENAAMLRLPIIAQEVGGLAELVTPDGALRTLPCHLAERGGMDGFYAARLQNA